jgi:hypothetical protein
MGLAGAAGPPVVGRRWLWGPISVAAPGCRFWRDCRHGMDERNNFVARPCHDRAVWDLCGAGFDDCASKATALAVAAGLGVVIGGKAGAPPQLRSFANALGPVRQLLSMRGLALSSAVRMCRIGDAVNSADPPHQVRNSAQPALIAVELTVIGLYRDARVQFNLGAAYHRPPSPRWNARRMPRPVSVEPRLRSSLTRLSVAESGVDR